MAKIALVINGKGGVGKDTLCELARKHYKVYNISSVDPIKAIARECGWDGRKDDKSRRFLSDLKALTVAYNDFPTVWAKERYLGFLKSEDEIMFLHIREPKEIEKFVSATGGEAKTLLIRGGDRMNKGVYGNASDDNVEDYAYDYYFTNDKSLEEAERDFCAMLASIME
ncbi:MAG: hypothetical protein IKC32_04040 [Clostridia bacterium]|nr:hypothetical protein [Clostridia bacterium]